MNTYGSVLREEVIEKVHDKALQILERVGMKIMHVGFYDALKKNNALVDETNNVVKFPPSLIEKTIEGIKKDIQNGRKQNLLNGVTSAETDDTLKLKIAGACIEFLDPMTNEVYEPDYESLVRLVAFGESIKEVKYVGNPVCLLKDNDGNHISGYLQRIKTAAIVAKYSSKYGSNEVWNEVELDLLIELGEIVRGGREKFLESPCFVTAKETIDPLFLPKEDGRILHMLAERNLPCTIIPMPIAGVTSPISIAGNIAMACAEVLGVMACIRAVCPDSMVSGGVISGVMDMREGFVSFAAPESILQDIGAACVFKQKYGQDFAIGTGYIDAAFPGAQSATEIYSKIIASKNIGHCYYPIGLLYGGKRWSPVQAYIGMEMAKYAHRLDMDISADENQMPIELFETVGISGSFLGEPHTVMNYRNNIWMSEIMERSLQARCDADAILDNAKQKWSDFIKKPIEPAVDEFTAKEIDKWEQKAVNTLASR